MKLFAQKELKAAYLYAESGGQALLLSVRAGVARLIDEDMCRLYNKAFKLGVLRPKLVRIGDAGQHVVLKGKPFARAVIECQTLELAL